MFSKIRHSRAGFTLMEMLIVLTIIGILMGLSILPYGVFMERARLSNSIDTIAQSWILAHKEVRNGLEFPDDTTSHTAIVLEFTPTKNSIQRYLHKVTPDTDGKATKIDLNNIINYTSDSGVVKKQTQKEITFENNIQIRSTNGINKPTTKEFKPDTDDTNKFFYVITPPYAEGKFYDKNGNDLNVTSKTIIVGYPGTMHAISHAKEVLLRPYLQ